MILNSGNDEKAQLIIPANGRELIDTKAYISNLKEFEAHPMSQMCIPFLEPTVIPLQMPVGYYIKSDKTHFKILMGQFHHMYLYRGENKDYPDFVSTIDRLNKNTIEHCIEWIKAEEFKEFFTSCVYYKRLSEIEVCGHKFLPDAEAVAQHYGFATNYLDFTQHYKVAQFFAMTYFDTEEGIYKPVTGIDGYKPRVYYIKISKLYDLCSEAFNIVGLQPLGRPSLQLAFAIDTRQFKKNLKENFEVCYLEEDKENSVYNFFNKGSDLFPNERILEDVNRIKCGNGRNAYIPLKWLLMYSKLFKKDVNKLRSQLAKRHYKVVDKYYALTEFEQNQINIETTIKILPWIEHNIDILPKDLNLPPID